MFGRINELKDSTCLQYQYRLNRQAKIKFTNELVGGRIKDLADLFKFIIYYRKKTSYAHNNKLQCCADRFRTSRDIYLTCLHYFPKITYKQFYDALSFLAIESSWGSYGYCEEAKGNTFRFAGVEIGIKALKLNEELNYKNPSK